MRRCAAFLIVCLLSLCCAGPAAALFNLGASDYKYCIDNDGSYPAGTGLIITSYPVSGISIKVGNDIIGTTPYSKTDAYTWYGYGQQLGPFIPFELSGTALGSNIVYGAFRVCPPPKITVVDANLNPALVVPTTTKTIIYARATAVTLTTLKKVTTVTTTTTTTTTSTAPVTTTESQQVPQQTAYIPPPEDNSQSSQQQSVPTDAAQPGVTVVYVTQDSGSQSSGSAGTTGTGSLSITTTPAGARIYIDGNQAGASPATIPGLAAGPHTVMLILDGYEPLSSTVTITTGETQTYNTGLIKTNKSPGFAAVIGIAAITAVIILRKRREE
jgi:hypothetical protein